MILVDTGPLVALFDPADDAHAKCVRILRAIEQPLWTTMPILTEAFYLLTPDSRGSQRLMDFVGDRGLAVWFGSDEAIERAFELMRRYSNVPMDFADASLVTAAETLGTRKVFTIDRKDFDVYRVRRGHRQVTFEMIA
jgi:predicted nucleic acid-binding protein